MICNHHVAEKFTLHHVTSRNEQKLIQFPQMQDMFLMITKCERKKIHKRTWIIPGIMESGFNQQKKIILNWRR